MSYPAGVKVEIEWTSGVWTDVTADLDSSAGIGTKFGRTSELSAPSIASCSFSLLNTSGDYTPHLASSAYYPNVTIYKRVRVSYNPGTVVWLFTGYVNNWAPSFIDGFIPMVDVSAVDLSSLLAQSVLTAAHQATILADDPDAFFPFSDAAGTRLTGVLTELSGLPSAPSWTYHTTHSQSSPVVFGGVSPIPQAEDVTSVTFPMVASNGIMLTSYSVSLNLNGCSVEGWVSIPNMGGTSLGSTAFSIQVGTGVAPDMSSFQLVVDWVDASHVEVTAYTSDSVGTFDVGAGPYTVPTAYGAGTTVALHLVATRSTAGAVVLYVNGVQVATNTYTGSIFASTINVSFNNLTAGTETFTASIANLALYSKVLTATQVANHYALGAGTTETTGTRIARYLALWGLTSSAWSLAAGEELVAAHPLAGKSIVTAIEELAISEGGGAAAYVTPDGLFTFVDRTKRLTQTPVITFDADADLDATGLALSFDANSLVNDSTVTRYGGETARYVDAVSALLPPDGYGPAVDTATTFSATAGSAFVLAQDRVAGDSTPGLRLNSLAVDLITTTTAGIAQAISSVGIGSRFRVSNLPATMPTTFVDLFVEGWSATFSQGGSDTASFTFDTSPADSRWQFQTADQGRLIETSTHCLTTAPLTASATTVTVESSPLGFSTSAGDYPMPILIDDEQCSITSAPAAPSSGTQTLTIARAQGGTRAAAHAGSARVHVVTGNLIL